MADVGSANYIRHPKSAIRNPLCLYSLFYRVDGDEPARASLIAELDDAGDLCEECVVFTDADIDTGLETCAPLPDKNRPARYQLARKTLHAQPLGMAIAAVS
jgi:hypothetical protein